MAGRGCPHPLSACWPLAAQPPVVAPARRQVPGTPPTSSGEIAKTSEVQLARNTRPRAGVRGRPAWRRSGGVSNSHCAANRAVCVDVAMRSTERTLGNARDIPGRRRDRSVPVLDVTGLAVLTGAVRRQIEWYARFVVLLLFGGVIGYGVGA